MIYVLWDFDTNNLVAEYHDVREAFALVLRGIERNGPNDTATLLLQAEDERGGVRAIAHGPALADLAHRTLTDTVPHSV